MDLKKIIEKVAILNAYLHKGKANPKAVLGKVISEEPKAKKDMKKTNTLIAEIVKQVNKLSLTEMKKRLDPKLLKAAQAPRPKQIKELPKAEMGKVITRMPPEPSKYPHIGHALSFLINYIYAKKYNGKCILRFDDTNPEKCSQEYVDGVFTDFIRPLGIKPDKVIYASNDMKKFYGAAEKLITQGDAYVCNCLVGKIRQLRHRGQGCTCRHFKSSLNMSNWKAMLHGHYRPGKAILRLKGDMRSNNQVMRDPVIFRISNKKHYLQGKKYHVWPLYDFESACEERITGVTHILRSSEFGRERIELQDFIKDKLGLPNQVYIQYGRFVIPGKPTQGRVIREMIEKKKVRGWDDPRLVTMRALLKRGFVPETFFELAKRVGLSKTTTRIDETVLGAINRQFIDKTAKRFFFVADPVEISVNKSVNSASAPIHPESKTNRKIPVGKKLYVTKTDFNKFSGKEIRLLHLYNIELGKKSKYTSTPNKNIQRIQWVSTPNIIVGVLMPDGRLVKGLGEPGLKKLPVGEIIQFERFGFCRLDQKSATKLLFIFGHK